MTEADLAEVMAIERAAEVHPWSEQHFRSELYNPIGDVSVLVGGDGRVEAFIVTRQTMDDAEVLNVAVRQDCRRRGHAKHLIGLALARAAAGRCCAMFLEVRRSNVAARKLYGSLGFDEVGVRKRYYEPNGEDAIVMRRVTEGLH